MKSKPGLTPSQRYNFSGGWVTMVSRTRLRPSQLTKAKNINLFIDGEFEVRGGYVKESTVAFGTIIDRFIHFKTDAYDKIVGYGGTYVKRLDKGTPDVWTTLSDAMPDTEDYRSMVVALEQLFIGSSTGVKKYFPAQTVLWNAGIAAPVTALTAAEGTAGNLLGTYNWYYTYYNSTTDAESNPNAVSNTITITTPAKRVTLSGFVASTDPQVDKMRIYRNTSGVPGQWWYVGEKTNTSANYEDNLADDGVGTEMSITNNVPPNSAILLWHMNRMFYVDGSKLSWSEPFKPGSVPLNNYQYIEKGDGGKIEQLMISAGNIIVFKNSSIHCFYFNPVDPAQSYYAPITQSYGIGAPMSAVNMGENVLFLSPEGLKKITNAGTTIEEIEVLVEGEFGAREMPPISNMLRICKASTLHRAVGFYYEQRNQYHLSVPFYEAATNDMTIVWCVDSNAFVVHEDFSVKATSAYHYYNSDLLYRSHNNEYIYKHDYGFTDDTAAITFDVQTGFHGVDNIQDEKRIRLLFPVVYGADQAIVHCELIKDFESPGSGFVVTVVHNGASYWGAACWGNNYWGASGGQVYRFRARVRGRLFSTRFYGTTTKVIGVAGYQFYYQPRAL